MGIHLSSMAVDNNDSDKTISITNPKEAKSKKKYRKKPKTRAVRILSMYYDHIILTFTASWDVRLESIIIIDKKLKNIRKNLMLIKFSRIGVISFYSGFHAERTLFHYTVIMVMRHHVNSSMKYVREHAPRTYF